MGQPKGCGQARARIESQKKCDLGTVPKVDLIDTRLPYSRQHITGSEKDRDIVTDWHWIETRNSGSDRCAGGVPTQAGFQLARKQSPLALDFPLFSIGRKPKHNGSCLVSKVKRQFL